MANSTRLRSTELDFDEIKQNLKDFLSSQSEFTDYNFEGSALATLLDLLAYNTHYNALYANFVANEMFLDSASKRASVISLAKHFGYTPTSAKSARAKINLSVTTSGSPQSLLLPKFTPFVTTIDGVDYTFYNLSNVLRSPVATNTLPLTPLLPKVTEKHLPVISDADGRFDQVANPPGCNGLIIVLIHTDDVVL
jgi:hypothetical protein